MAETSHTSYVTADIVLSDTEIWMMVTGRAQCMLLYILWEAAIGKNDNE